jgi:hypothetical protein
VILLTLFTSLAAVNVLTYLVIKLAFIEDPEDDTPDMPSRESEYKLQSIWKITNSNPIADLDDSQFNVYVGFVLWMTMVLAGIGTELLFWTTFLRAGWSCEAEATWKFAEFAFPLLGVTAFGLAMHHDYMAVMFLVAGMFKLGFPEILTYMHAALYLTDPHKNEGRYLWISAFLNSVGLITHHSACAFIISMMLNSVITPDRYIIAPILLLLMQHWFALLKYASFPMYVVLQLFLEFWFEWTVLSVYQFVIVNHWTAALGGGTMIVAHWMFLLAAALELVLKEKFVDAEEISNTELLTVSSDAEETEADVESQI